jgi:zinc/manganese transport system ATP-binding protein
VSGSSPAGPSGRVAAPPAGPASGDDRPALELRDAAVAVGRHTVWSGVDLVVGRGEFAAVLGPNGVGKSTLLKVVLGLVPLSAGDVRVLGERAGEPNHRIGYLPQRRSFDAGLRVRGVDVVRMGLDGHRWGVRWPGSKRRDADHRVAEVIDLVGASQYATRPIGALSGGEQQRLLIAQALVPNPELLLLDEPLDSLDPSNQQAVALLVETICRDRGVTVIMVAHDVNPILAYLDQVVYLAPSGAVAGTPADVITGPNLSALYDAPIEVLETSDGRLVVVGQPEPPGFHTDRHAH